MSDVSQLESYFDVRKEETFMTIQQAWSNFEILEFSWMGWYLNNLTRNGVLYTNLQTIKAKRLALV